MIAFVETMKRNCLLPLLISSLTFTGCKREAATGSGRGGAFAIQAVVIEAKVQPVSESLALVGTITANETVEIKSETDGTLEEVLFVEGQSVKQGDLLLRLDESKFSAAVNEAEANFKLSETTYERSRQLLRDKLVSQQEHDQAAAQYQANKSGLELKKRQMKDARIYASFKGIMSTRQVSPGQVISKNTTLTWLVDLDPVKAEVNVPERYLSQIALGQKMTFTVAAFPSEKFQGEVYFISPQLDAATRTALVKARIPNPNHRLKGGMFASLTLTLQLRDSAIVIPEPALMSNGDNVTVFVVDAKGIAQMRPVKIGLRLAGKAEVLSGLEAGESVVVEGGQKLFPGAAVKAAPAEASAPYLK